MGLSDEFGNGLIGRKDRVRPYLGARTLATFRWSARLVCVRQRARERMGEDAYFPWHANQKGAVNFAPAEQVKQQFKFGEREKAKLSQGLKESVYGIDNDEIVEPVSVTEPYHSPRLRALLERGGALTSRGETRTTTGEELDYTVLRSTGLGLGYNLFTMPPPPPPKNDGPAPLLPKGASWYVDVNTLEAGDAAGAATGLSGKQRAKRQKDAQVLMRHNPTVLLVEEAKALNMAASRLVTLDVKVTEALEKVTADQAAIKENSSRRDLVNAAIGSGNAARETAALHARADAELDTLATSLDKTWRALQDQGQAARKAALVRMSEIEEGLQTQLEALELQLTDHVLLGTAEEAERMRKAPGHEGDQLRAILHEQEALAGRQRLQKAVLVQVARKAVAATEAHEIRMSKARARLESSSGKCKELGEAVDTLESALARLTGDNNNLTDAVTARARAAEVNMHTHEGINRALVRISSLSDLGPGGTARASVKPPPIETILMRQPTSRMAGVGWVAKLITIKVASPVLGLGMARDDSLPSVVVDELQLKRVRSAPITKLLRDSTRRSSRSYEKVFELSRALVVARIDPSSPADGQVMLADVIVAVDGVDIIGESAPAELLHLVGGSAADTPAGGARVGQRIVQLTILRPAYDNASKPAKKGWGAGKLLGWLGKKKK